MAQKGTKKVNNIKNTKKVNNSKVNTIDDKKTKIVFVLVVGIIVILSLLLIISGTFGNFEKVKLSTNDNEIFSVADLTINDISFGSRSTDIKKILGKPTKEETKIIGNYEYLILTYPGLKLELKEYYDNYILTKAEITSSKYTTSRNIKVGNRISKVIKKYNVSIESGNYIYKNYNVEALNEDLIKDNVYFGIRNKDEIRYVNRDAVIDGNKTNIAILKFEYKNGKVYKIIWSYDTRY